MKTLTLNKDQKLYVIRAGNSYTCLGFEVCLKRVTALNTELGNIIKYVARIGSKRLYYQYTHLTSQAAVKHKATGWKSQSELIPEFIGREGWRVQIVDKYGETRRFIIGKSTGFIPCHLEILKSNSSGGASVTGYPFKSVNFIERVR